MALVVLLSWALGSIGGALTVAKIVAVMRDKTRTAEVKIRLQATRSRLR